jgi:hypothetical protein
LGLTVVAGELGLSVVAGVWVGSPLSLSAMLLVRLFHCCWGVAVAFSALSGGGSSSAIYVARWQNPHHCIWKHVLKVCFYGFFVRKNIRFCLSK